MLCIGMPSAGHAKGGEAEAEEEVVEAGMRDSVRTRLKLVAAATSQRRLGRESTTSRADAWNYRREGSMTEM